MSVYEGANRRRILDEAIRQINASKEQALLADMSFNDWNQAFDQLNTRYWGGRLPKIPVSTESTRKRQLGWYGHSGYIKLSTNKGMTPTQMLGVLLHEMCHHWVEVTFGHGETATGGRRVIGHGKQWKAEMRRVGYMGKITKYSGLERFEGVTA